MTRLTFSTTINAPKELVWRTMLEDETYRKWTSAFAEGRTRSRIGSPAARRSSSGRMAPAWSAASPSIVRTSICRSNTWG